MIARYWTNPKDYNKWFKQKTSLKRRISSPQSTASSFTMNTPFTSISQKERNTGTNHINEFSITPDGTLNCRVNSSLDHLPMEKQSSRALCALYRWVESENQSHMKFYITCGVNLCVKCYWMFQTDPHLLAKKAVLKNKYKK